MGSTQTTLDQKTDEFLAGFGQVWASIASLSLPEKRKELHRLFSVPRSEMEPIHTVEDRKIAGPNGDIPIRIFIPEGEGPFPVMVYFHHGGWVLGSLDECEPVCRHMANASKIVVVAVDYRLAPEHKYPVPLQDAFAATQWAIANAYSIKGNPDRVGVGGESAGGNLAAAIALMARDQRAAAPAYQALFYPILTCDLNLDHYKNGPDRHLITVENMSWFYAQYLNNEEEKNHAYASPVKAEDFTNLPPALIITAEWDPLRFEGAEYAQSLRAAQVEVSHTCYPQVIHGFFGFPIYPEEASLAMAQIKEFVYS